jgi:hypothetical protein
MVGDGSGGFNGKLLYCIITEEQYIKKRSPTMVNEPAPGEAERVVLPEPALQE